MQLEATTWVRDSHELFDYESRSVEKSFHTVESSIRVYRRGVNVFLGPDRDGGMQNSPDLLIDIFPLEYPQSADDSPLEYLLRAVYLDGRCIVQSSDRQPESTQVVAKKLWTVVKEIGQCALSEGDIIKLGRFKLRVRQICVGPNDDPVRPDLSGGGSSLNSVGSVAPPEANGMPCRICLLDGSGSDEDPLIQACNCRGSIQYVHLGCLRYWINGRLCLTDASKHAYLFRQLSCELCKVNYPVEVIMPQGEKLPLVPMPETRAPYIVLENMMRQEGDQSGGPASRGIFVISLAGKKMLKLGRGHESDVRIADVSISRWHATVSFTDNGQFIIEDHGSKFGTLVSMRRPRVVDPTCSDPAKARLCVQAGRTLLKFNYPPVAGGTQDSSDMWSVTATTQAAQ
jgi:hypothetical protein